MRIHNPDMHAHEARLSDCDQWLGASKGENPPVRGGLDYCEVDVRECTVERFDLRSRCFVFGM